MCVYQEECRGIVRLTRTFIHGSATSLIHASFTPYPRRLAKPLRRSSHSPSLKISHTCSFSMVIAVGLNKGHAVTKIARTKTRVKGVRAASAAAHRMASLLPGTNDDRPRNHHVLGCVGASPHRGVLSIS